MANIVFIATSLDGYIADQQGGLEWLHRVPNPEQQDMGFAPLMERVDAIVMGRHTFETVLSFGVEWPYPKPVYVLSNSLKNVPPAYRDKVFIVTGEPTEIVSQLNQRGHQHLYIDGGITIQRFLQADLIDELCISTLPTLLGGGVPLFGHLLKPLDFTLQTSQVYLNSIVQSHYVRNRYEINDQNFK